MQPFELPPVVSDGVTAEGLAKRFGDRWALRGVSVRAEAGSVVALVGHNGSGKTTLLRILGTTLRPSRGAARVFGHDLVRDAEAVRGLVGVLYHAPGLYGDLTVRENLEFARRMWGGGTAVTVDEALARVGLAAVGAERAAALSSGMTRRLALARLVLRPPRLLLLDEPFASFDADGIELVRAMVRETAARGGVALIATHDPERAAPLIDRVVRLREGRTEPERSPAPRLAAEVAR